jgi:membrane protease YdiL (CAAX protease family)
MFEYRIRILIPTIYFGIYVLFVLIILGFGQWLAYIPFIDSILQVVLYGSIFSLFIIFFKDFWRQTFQHLWHNFGRILLTLVAGVFIILAVNAIMNLIYVWLGITDTSANQAALQELADGEIVDKINLAIFSFLLAPMVEEMVFRNSGFKWVPSSSPALKILITSFAFGAIHVVFAGDLIQIFYYAGLGAVLGLVYYRSENILTSIVLHMMFNALGLYAMFFY